MLLDSVLPPEAPDPYSGERPAGPAGDSRPRSARTAAARRDQQLPGGRRRRSRTSSRAKPLHGKATEANGRANDSPGGRRRPALARPVGRPEPGPGGRTAGGGEGCAERQHAAARARRRPEQRRLGRAVDRAELGPLRGHGVPRRAVPVVARHSSGRPARARAGRDRSPAARHAGAVRRVVGQPSGTPTSASAGRARRAARRSVPARSPTCRCSPSAAASTCARRPPGATSVVARFPQGKLLVVPGIGHSTVTADFSACAARAVHSWMTGAVVPAACPRSKPLVVDVPGLPAPGQAKPAHPATPAKTLATVSKTVHEAEAAWLMTVGLSGTSERIPGVFGGYFYATSGQSFKLVRYSVARGVAVSGTIRITKFGPPHRVPGHADGRRWSGGGRRARAAGRRAARDARRPARPVAADAGPDANAGPRASSTS